MTARLAGWFSGLGGAATDALPVRLGGQRNTRTATAPVDLQALSPRQADGGAFAWVPQERNWHVVVEAPANCSEPCARMLDTLHRVWQAEGRHADRMFVLWHGELPEGPRWRTLVPLAENPELLAALPTRAAPDALPVYLIDGRGFLVMCYAPGFDPSGLRKDLARLLK